MSFSVESLNLVLCPIGSPSITWDPRLVKMWALVCMLFTSSHFILKLLFAGYINLALVAPTLSWFHSHFECIFFWLNINFGYVLFWYISITTHLSWIEIVFQKNILYFTLLLFLHFQYRIFLPLELLVHGKYVKDLRNLVYLIQRKTKQLLTRLLYNNTDDCSHNIQTGNWESRLPSCNTKKDDKGLNHHH